MNNTTRFDGKGEIYAKARAKYSVKLLDYMKHIEHTRRKCLCRHWFGYRDFYWTAVELRLLRVCRWAKCRYAKKAEEKLSENKNFTSIYGTDSNTNLPDQSVDFITAAQAFHWFDAETFKKECKRILKPNGKVIIVYNSVMSKPLVQKLLLICTVILIPNFMDFQTASVMKNVVLSLAATAISSVQTTIRTTTDRVISTVCYHPRTLCVKVTNGMRSTWKRSMWFLIHLLLTVYWQCPHIRWRILTL